MKKKRSYVSDHLYRILITIGYGSRKTNALLNLMSQQDDIDKIYFYTKALIEAKYELLM